jgi:Flp pilus assembly protein TadG
MRNLLRLIDRFRRDRRGNLAVIFGLAAIPLVSAIGSAVDYSMATRVKAKLQSAADAASVASISQNSLGYLAAAQMTGDGSVTAGVTDAQNVFNGNMSTISDYNNLNVKLYPATTVTKTGIKLNSTVSFQADVPTSFMKVIGYQTLTVTGTSKSTASLPPYLDFYLMLDVSGSMGLPSSDAEQTRLSKVNPDDFSVYPNGCTFACHFQAKNSCTDPAVGEKTDPTLKTVRQAYPTNNYCLGYLISRVSQAGYKGLLQTTTNYPMKGVQLPAKMILAGVTSAVTPGVPNSLITGNSASQTNSLTPVTSCPTEGGDPCIQLRADAVGNALTLLFQYANSHEKVSKQFRIGLYPFIQDLYSYFPLTSSISPSDSIVTAANNLATLLDTGNTPKLGNLGSGGTHFENAFPSMSTTITSVGNGSTSTNPQPFVFLVTDGAQNFQTCCGFSGSNSATVMPAGALSPCKPLRDRGITISVLYIPYQTIQNPTTIFNNEDNVANANIPYIPPSLTDCASPGFFYTANTTADITTALKAMFDHAVQTAHLTP